VCGPAHADNPGRTNRGGEMVGFVILGIVMLIWVMTWESSGTQA
jgi:hypothetical protein